MYKKIIYTILILGMVTGVFWLGSHRSQEKQITPPTNSSQNAGTKAGFQLIKKEDQAANYSGSVNLHGTFAQLPAGEVTGGLVCFYPDSVSSKLIPRSSNNTRSAWFCFNNNKAAIAAFRIDEAGKIGYPACDYIVGIATIEISGYKEILQAGENYDTTKLVDVINFELPSSCSRGGFNPANYNS